MNGDDPIHIGSFWRGKVQAHIFPKRDPLLAVKENARYKEFALFEGAFSGKQEGRASCSNRVG
jgi:hypothetical protein